MLTTRRKSICVGAVLVLTCELFAQTKSGGIPVNGDVFGSDVSRSSRPDMTRPNMVGISGKVVMEDGGPVSQRVLIQSDCHGTITSEGYTDTKGAFSFEFANKEPGQASTASETPTTRVDPSTIRYNAPRSWRDCDVRAVLPGYASDTVALASRAPSFGSTDIGIIRLRRSSSGQALTESITTGKAPDKARKEYERGLEAVKQGKLDSAQEKFQKAVDAYPQYAVAWLELGKVQAQKNDSAGARQSFHQSIAADKKFMSPYRELALLAGHDKQWQELADTSDQLIAMDGQHFAEFYFYNAIAKFHLQNYDAAENSALAGIKIDIEHSVPKLEYVLGMTEAQKRNYQAAAEHVRKYLNLSPNGPDAEDTKKKLEEIDRLAATSASKP